MSSKANELMVQNMLRDVGFNKLAVAAIMGNIDVETGGSFDYMQKQIGRPNGGYGLFQLDFQKNNYFDFCSKYGYSDSARAQVKYAYESIYGSERKFNGFGDSKKIADAFKGDDLKYAT